MSSLMRPRALRLVEPPVQTSGMYDREALEDLLKALERAEPKLPGGSLVRGLVLRLAAIVRSLLR